MTARTVAFAVLLSLSSLMTTSPLSAEQIFCVLNPNRDREQLEQDAKAVFSLVVRSSEGDEVICLDTMGNDIFKYTNVGGTRLKVKRAKESALHQLKAYCQSALNQVEDTQTHNIPQIFTHLAHQLRIANDNPVVVLFDSGIHRSEAFEFVGSVPSDGFITHPPFSLIPSLPARFILLVDADDFLNLQHRNGMQGFYARLIANKNGTLIAFTHVHDQIAQLISQKAHQPVVRDVELRDSKLILHHMKGIQPIITPDIGQAPTPQPTPPTDHAHLDEDQVSIEGKVATIRGTVPPGKQDLFLQAEDTRFPLTVNSDGSFSQDIILKNGANSVELFSGSTRLDSMTINAELDVPALRISLSWVGGNSDIDLYAITGNDAIWFRHQNRPFGELDRDDTDGTGPEHITIPNTINGVVQVWVHYYASHDHSGTVEFTVEVFRNDQLAGRYQGTLSHSASGKAGPPTSNQSHVSWAHITDIRL